MQNEPNTIYKLIVLYMLDKVQIPLTNRIISEYVLGKEYTNYFNLQTAFTELLDEQMIAIDMTYKTTYYHLTDKGKETLTLFQSQLSPEIRDEIEHFLKENHYSIIEEVGTFTDYRVLPTGDYESTCALKENGHTLMELKITTSSEDEAAKICASFSEKNESIYQDLIQHLLS